MLKKVLQFKHKVLRVQPGLNNLKMSVTDWNSLYQSFSTLELKRITSSFILTELSYIKNIDYTDLVLLLSLRSIERHEKKQTHSHQLMQKKIVSSTT